MRKWMQYCHHRTEDKLHGAVYMVTEHAGGRKPSYMDPSNKVKAVCVVSVEEPEPLA